MVSGNLRLRRSISRCAEKGRDGECCDGLAGSDRAVVGVVVHRLVGSVRLAESGLIRHSVAFTLVVQFAAHVEAVGGIDLGGALLACIHRSAGMIRVPDA